MLHSLPTKTLSADPQLAATRAHFTEHRSALAKAAGLIGGDTGTGRVLRLMSDLREAFRLDRAIRCRLIDLHRFLSLDPIIGNMEPDLSAGLLLDPAGPEVEQICLLTDRLFDLLKEIGEMDEDHEALAHSLSVHSAA